MDSQKIVARSNGFLPKTATPYVAPSVPIRAFPSVDDDEEETDSDYVSDDVDEGDFDYVSDELEDEGVAGDVVEVNGRKEFSASSSFRILSSVGGNSCSEEEEEEAEEGGYLSGEEKFVGALERPYVVEKVEQEEEDVNVAFVEPFESLRPIAKLSQDDEDDADVELSVSESDEEVANDLIEVSKAYVRSKGPSVLEVDNMEEDHFESVVLKSVEIDGLEFMTEGASVVESNNVGGNVAEPRVVTVEDVKPDIVASSDSERPEEEKEIDEDLSNEQVEICEKDKSVENVIEDLSELVTPSNDDLTVPDGVKMTSESDVVEEATQVDLLEPGVLVVNGAEEIINLPDAEDRDDILVRSLIIEGSLKINCLARDEVLVDCGEGDSKEVVSNMDEAKGGEVKGDEVQVTEKSIEEKEDEPLTAKLEDEVVMEDGIKFTTKGDTVMEDGIKFTTKGDSVVEATHLNVSEPVVEVVKDTLEGGNPEVNLLDSDVGEDVELNGTVILADEPSHSDVYEITETGIDEIQDEMNEADQSAQVHAISDSEVLDQKINADGEIQHLLEEGYYTEDSDSEDETDGVSVRSIEAAKQFLEELEQRSVGGSHSGAQRSHYHSERIDEQVVTDSDEEVGTDEEESRKQFFESAALAAFLKAATGGAFDSNTISAQDPSELFFANRPADLVSSLRGRNAPQQSAMKESEQNLSVEERKMLESIHQLRVKFLRLMYRLGQSSEDLIAAHVLHRLALVAGRSSSQVFNHEADERTAKALENQGEDNLNFSLNILVIGKCGVGKSATINSIFGEKKTSTSPFESATAHVKEITGVVDGVHIRVLDTPGLRTNVVDQHFNLKILASVKKATKKCPPDVVLYVDRLDSHIGNINDLPLLRTITSSLGPSIWQSAIVTLTHAGTAPPDGLSGTPLNYEVFVDRRSRAVQHSIGETLGEDQLMNQILMIPVSLAENHYSCSKNRKGQKILPNGQAWRPQLLMFCYSMKILSDTIVLGKQPNQFDHQQVRPTLPFLLSWLLQSRMHPKFSADLGGEDSESGIDVNELLESEGEEEDEYDQLPSFKPLKKSQLALLSKEQLKAYYEEYDYRVKLLQEKELKKALKTMKEMKKRKVPESELLSDDEANPQNSDPTYAHAPLPDMVLPPSFDCGDPSFRYRFLESSSKLISRPVLNKKCWDHDFGYDIVNLEQSLVIASRFPADITVQLTKDKKKFKAHLDSSVAAKHGYNGASTVAGFDIRNIEKHRAYTIRGETKLKNLKKNTTTAGFSVTYLDENIATGVKIEDQQTIGKHLVLTGSTGAVRCQSDTIYGANLEIKLHDSDFPISQDQSSLVLSLVNMGGKLAFGAHFRSQFSVGRKSKVDVGLGLNNQSCGQISIQTSTSEPLQVALVSILPVILGILKAISWPEH